jgi:hypothetical protein
MVTVNGNLPIFIIVYQVIKYGTVSCSVQELYSTVYDTNMLRH